MDSHQFYDFRVKFWHEVPHTKVVAKKFGGRHVCFFCVEVRVMEMRWFARALMAIEKRSFALN